MEPDTSTSAFDLVIWGGAALSMVGLFGIIWCILRVMRAKKAALDDDSMKSLLQGLLPINLGSLFLSVIGLMMVIVGVSLS